MKILKFGGSSLANAGKFLSVADIVLNENNQSSISVVLSAPQGITNLLVSLVESIQVKNNCDEIVEQIGRASCRERVLRLV